ncbi:hypothetical protein Solca_4273 [Solitalea canadensis DSM 3403]|uniref:Aspartyl protease n=1 Tax=Solitalea canadensis (strain ATCC 29591 / DSM 3403 / JCM 21819 / LMG 8368 / NBRC 15130 / NCIMB 12057 / USAM 9D) TaxID=929556 RepID=H8KM81_SOLCM|nr:hypothetical protein Solca_4273 [Solitalea canadensis DSM 3403]
MLKKTYTICLIFFLFVQNIFGQQSSLNELIRTKNFFAAQQVLANSEKEMTPEVKAIYNAVILNAFGMAQKSNDTLLSISKNKRPTTDSLGFLFHQTLYDNYVKLFNYREAAISGSILLKNYASYYTANNLKDEKEALKIWELLKDIPVQKITQPKAETIQLKKDLAQLWNIPVKQADSVYDFVFDSGAGISTITDSYARKLNLKIVSDSTVGINSGLTGNTTYAKLGVAAKLNFNNIEVSNCIFLIFPDSALSFASGVYKIKGIIGFPVIKELGTLHFTENQLLITKDSTPKTSIKNMTLDQLKPVIYLTYRNELLPFTFDSGAQSSLLSDVFYKKYQSDLDSKGVPTPYTIGGASGQKTLSAVKIPEIKLFCGASAIILKNCMVSKEMLDTNQDVYYGNIGQDVIKQFKTMVINFKESYIAFEN